MSNQSVDLSNLREMIGNDADLEKELIQTFFEGAQDCLKGLEAATSDEDWRKNAHAFKGISRNLGAMPLGDLCYEAQERSGAGPEEKAQMLAGIKDEYARVEAFLRPLA